MHKFSYLISLLLILFTVACSSNDKKQEYLFIEDKVEILYNAAMDALAKKRYLQATALFAEVDRQHPYSEWARRSLLMSAYTKYLSGDYDEARSDLERFITLHPGNENADYAHYLLAMSYYKQMNDVGRDQSYTAYAIESFQNLLNRFPESEYKKDAQLKLDISLDQIAGKEMEVGRFYQRRNNYIAAVKRFNRVIDYYQTTQQVPEALHRLVESYLSLGLVNEARKSASVLYYNYPDSKWYKHTYKLLRENNLLTKSEVVSNSNGLFEEQVK